jgi:hypothetical protein
MEIKCSFNHVAGIGIRLHQIVLSIQEITAFVQEKDPNYALNFSISEGNNNLEKLAYF